MILGENIHVRARVCKIRRERDENNKWQWSLQYSEACECTRFAIFAGMQSCSPASSVKAFQADYPPNSTAVADVREHFGIQCNGKIQLVFFHQKIF